MQDRSELLTGEQAGELRLLVDHEMSRLLESAVEVDLATVYRTIVGLIGAHAAPYIAEVIGAGLRAGDIQMETRSARPDGALVAFIRRAECRRAAA